MIRAASGVSGGDPRLADENSLRSLIDSLLKERGLSQEIAPTSAGVSGPWSRLIRSLQLLEKQLIDQRRIRLALRGFHDLADKEAEYGFLSRSILLELLRICGDHLLDDGLELRAITDLLRLFLLVNLGEVL